MAKRILPTPEQLRQLLRYEPDTGKLFWKERPASMFPPGNTSSEANCKLWNAKFAGREAFTSDNGEGYRNGAILGRSYRAHRVAWAIHYGVWPVGDIDHVNMDRSDNRIANLRLATRSENMSNKRLRPGNTSGFKGVSFKKSRNRWVAQICHKGKGVYLGLFDTPEAAHAAYCEAAKKYHGEFARTE